MRYLYYIPHPFVMRLKQGWRNDSRGRGGGTRPWGPSRKRVPKCLIGPNTTYTTFAIAKKQSKRSKKGPFFGFPGSHPGNGINGARRGRSLPVPPSPRFLQPWAQEWRLEGRAPQCGGVKPILKWQRSQHYHSTIFSEAVSLSRPLTRLSVLNDNHRV